MRIENKCADNSLSMGGLLTGYTYKSTASGDYYLAGRDCQGARVIMNLSNGNVYYSVAADVKFTVAEAHVVVTKE